MNKAVKRAYWDGIATMGVICLILVLVSCLSLKKNMELQQENIQLNSELTASALK